MKWQRDFEIAFVGLAQGEHHFNYQIEDSFFEHFATPDFSNSDIEVNMTLDKKSDIFLLHFDIHGKAITACDRCGDDFEMQIWDEFDHVIKLVGDSDVSDGAEPDISLVSRLDSILDVSKLVYEYVILGLPIQKVHSTDEEGNSNCNEEVIKRINTHAPNTSNKMWDALKNKIKKEK